MTNTAATAVFVGTSRGRAVLEAQASFIYTYMTADQMQAKVTALTGYEHQDFTTFADILGRNDPMSGSRTNSQPSLLSILLIEKIAAEVAALVVEREQFLNDAERIVFNGVALDQAPSEASLASLLTDLYRRWLNVQLSRTSLQVLLDLFHEALPKSGPSGAFARVLAFMLEHGGLYYV